MAGCDLLNKIFNWECIVYDETDYQFTIGLSYDVYVYGWSSFGGDS